MKKTSQDIKALRQSRKAALIQAYGNKCICCGYDFTKRNGSAEFHHIDSTTKTASISTLIGKVNSDEYLQEAKKCILLCSNCHRELHSELGSYTTADSTWYWITHYTD